MTNFSRGTNYELLEPKMHVWSFRSSQLQAIFGSRLGCQRKIHKLFILLARTQSRIDLNGIGIISWDES
jgi:hypothetical protein